jgi:hypothetical protein
MADWTNVPIPPGEKPPGPINPPAPGDIKPTDNGWNTWAGDQIKASGLKWGPECRLTFEVSATGRTEERPLDGDKPDDFATDYGWKEDRTYETTPPEAYQDFTRWVRHYGSLRLQKCVEYRARVVVWCGDTMVAPAPSHFWVAEGPPILSYGLDEYYWTKTSGLERNAAGEEYKWTTTGKKQRPYWSEPKPLTDDFSHPQTTPPSWLVHPIGIDWHIDPKWDLKPKWDLGPGWKFGGWPKGYNYPLGPDWKPDKWFKLGEVIKPDQAPKGDKKK